MARLALPTEQLKSYPTRQFLADIWHYVSPYRVPFIMASALRLLSDLTNLFPAVGFSFIVNELTKGSNASSVYVWHIFLLLIASSVTMIFGKQSAKYIMFQISERTALDAKLATTRHLASLDIMWHEQENSGNKLKRIERGGDAIDQVLRLWINSYIEIAVNLIGTIIIVTRFDHTISTILVLFCISFYWLSSYLIAPAMRATRTVNVNEESFTGVLFELISNIRTVKLLGMKQSFLTLLQSSTVKLYQTIRQRINRFQTRTTILSIWLHTFRLIIVSIAIMNIFAGHYQVGFIVLITTYFSRIIDAIGELSDNAQQVSIARDGVARMQEIVLQPIVIDANTGKQEMAPDWKELSLQHVHFGYGDKPVLNDVTLTIHRGEKVGIIGKSGAGKSTLFKLLLKERENFTGSIQFDTHPIQSIRTDSYFKRVAVVLQETEVFNFSLKENVILASEDKAHDKQALQRALAISHVDEFVQKLPQGVDTLIGEKGFRLSGGEKQRLGIARAVFKEPELLFLDEATSHLDSESEQKIQDSLQKFFKNVTAVVIAHRLSTIKQMDRILVLEKGRIIEEGSFDALYKKKGRFRDLWEKQKL